MLEKRIISNQASNPTHIIYPIVDTNEANSFRLSRLCLKTTKRSGSCIDEDFSESLPQYRWSPLLRRTMAGISTVGLLETAYLTIHKAMLNEDVHYLLCSDSEDNGCGSVLSGPYSTIPGSDIPLASVGLAAYTTILVLALFPLQRTTYIDNAINRTALTAISTAMCVFSAFLMGLLLVDLKQACLFCFVSAICSFSLAAMSWLGGGLHSMELQQEGNKSILASIGTSLIAASAAFVLYFGAPTYDPNSLLSSNSGDPFVATPQSSLSASNSVAPTKMLSGESPPQITTQSSVRALNIATRLQNLDTRFYGAYWCSHCFEQKQTLGVEAMSKIPYIECSNEGKNGQMPLCKEKKIPGYPTWEIAGRLYPGEQALDELEEIIDQESITHR